MYMLLWVHHIKEMNVLFCSDILELFVQSNNVPAFVGTFVASQCLQYIHRAWNRGEYLKQMTRIVSVLILFAFNY